MWNTKTTVSNIQATLRFAVFSAKCWKIESHCYSFFCFYKNSAEPARRFHSHYSGHLFHLAISSATFFASSFSMRCFRCVFTVFGLIKSRSAVSDVLIPCDRQTRTSFSREDSSGTTTCVSSARQFFFCLAGKKPDQNKYPPPAECQPPCTIRLHRNSWKQLHLYTNPTIWMPPKARHA